MTIALLVALIAACDGHDASSDASHPADAEGDGDGDETDASASAWRDEPPVPIAIQEHAGAVHDGRLFIAGGIDDRSRVVADVRSFDPVMHAWRDEPSLPAPRHHLMLASTGDDLYAIGGMATLAFDAVDSAWVLTRSATEWQPISALPSPRAAGLAVAIDGVVFVVGGQAERELVAVTLRLSSRDGSWEERAPIPRPREHTAGFVFGTEVWVVGGRAFAIGSAGDAVDVYDTQEDAWHEGPSLRSIRGGHGAALLDGVAYVAGGELTSRALTEVEALDLAGEASEWRASAPMASPHHGFALLATGGRLYAIAGADEPAFGAFARMESYAP